jgi:glyoxylase-like metal-dependent hydrolase (beta-lactamase superfamily II)
VIGATPLSASAVHLLSDGVSYWDGGGAFGLVPRPKWSKLLPPDELNRVPQDLRCVLIEIPGPAGRRPTRILVDCGVGDKPNDVIAAQYEVRRPRGSLLDDLARRGLQPADIDVVVLTHLHGDHAGWATRIVGASGGASPQASPQASPDDPLNCVPTFPNARYCVQRQEYDDATHPNERTRNTYFPVNFLPLMRHGVLDLLDGPADIAPGVRVEPTPGHTAGHQSVVIEPSGHWAIESLSHLAIAPMTQWPNGSMAQSVLVLGDLATYMIQFARLPWLTAYDVLPLVNIETKRRWQHWALERRALLISPHDTQIPIGRLARTARGYLEVESAVNDQPSAIGGPLTANRSSLIAES